MNDAPLHVEPLDPALRSLIDLAESDPPQPSPLVLEQAHAAIAVSVARPLWGWAPVAGVVVVVAVVGVGIAFAPKRGVEVAPPAPVEVIEVVEVVDAPIPIVVDEPAVEAPPAPTPKPRAVVEVSTREAEARLLEVARTDMKALDYEGARSTLEEHARRWPRGVLGEERDALSALVAVRSGAPDGVKRVDDFIARHPDSLYRGMLRGALRE